MSKRKRKSVFDNSVMIGARHDGFHFFKRPDGKYWARFDKTHEELPEDPAARREFLDFLATCFEREAKAIRKRLKGTLN